MNHLKILFSKMQSFQSKTKSKSQQITSDFYDQNSYMIQIKTSIFDEDPFAKNAQGLGMI